MNDFIQQGQTLFHALTVRKDVYYRYWQKKEKSGYSIAYDIDWKAYRDHQLRGGTIATFTAKHQLELTPTVYADHIQGIAHIGVVPFVTDTEIAFLQLPADEATQERLHIFQIPHTIVDNYYWVRFAEPVSYAHVAQLFGVPHIYARGYVVLPKNIDWPTVCAQLVSSQMISRATLQQLWRDHMTPIQPSRTTSQEKYEIVVGSQILIPKSMVDVSMRIFLEKHLRFVNTEYTIKQRMGLSTYGVQKYHNLINERVNHFVVPRGFLPLFTEYLTQRNLPYTLVDERILSTTVSFTTHIQPRAHQRQAITAGYHHESGVVVAPPGAGKTVIGLAIVAHRQQSTLILVHRKQLLDQWVERIEQFLHISRKDIGIIAQGKVRIGTHITIAMMQTFVKQKVSKLKQHFGTILVDECHHIPAKSFQKIMHGFAPRYLYGLTATPIRKYNDEKLIFYLIGDIIHTVKQIDIAIEKNDNINENIVKDTRPQVEVFLRNTKLHIPFEFAPETSDFFSKIITYDSTRNMQIVADVKSQLQYKDKILILTERKEHVELLALYLQSSANIVKLTGDYSARIRTARLKQVVAQDFDILIATGQLFGEGMDIPALACLFLVYPFAFEGKLIQYIGRIQRSSTRQVVFDYIDTGNSFLAAVARKRLQYYEKARWVLDRS